MLREFNFDVNISGDAKYIPKKAIGGSIKAVSYAAGGIPTPQKVYPNSKTNFGFRLLARCCAILIKLLFLAKCV